MSTAAGRESIKALADGPAGAFAAGALGMGVIGALMNFRSRKPTAPIHPNADKFKLEAASKGDAATPSGTAIADHINPADRHLGRCPLLPQVL